MSLWNPVKLDNELLLDRRVILNKAKEVLEKDLKKVQKKIEMQVESQSKFDMYGASKSKRSKNRIRLDELCNERDTIRRRIDLIRDELNG